MCESERPREKLLSSGTGSLSNGELLAVLLRSGTRSTSAIELAQQLLNKCDGKLCNLVNMGGTRLCAMSGIGRGKAASILAALELGRRFIYEESLSIREPVSTARKVFEMMLPDLKGLKHEECWVMLLNEGLYLIRKIRLSSGGGRATVIDVRHVIRSALEYNAAAIILVHNHPSGCPTPSEADRKQTSLLKKGTEACGLQLADHVIVCDGAFFSFAEERSFKA